jgi:hypothetical protein
VIKEVSKILRQLERPAARADGWTVKPTADQHYVIRRNGAFVTTLSSRPGDPRALTNSRVDLRAAGFTLGKRKDPTP